MSSDYTDFAKDPREDSRKRKLMVVHALLATAMAAILGGAWVVQRKGEVAQTRAAAPPPAGPACQPLTEAAYLAMPRPADRLFTYGGTVFGRRFGHVECDMAGGEGLSLGRVYPVCRFTAPAVITVRTAAGTTYFAPGVGRPAVVSLKDGKPSCVLGT